MLNADYVIKGIVMLLRSSKLILQAATYVLGLIALLASMFAHSGTYKFEYTSDLYGRLGYFTVDEVEFPPDNGSYFPVFLQNEAIDDLSFQYQGDEWGVEDIVRSSMISFTYTQQSRILKVRNSGNGFADNGRGWINLYRDGNVSFSTNLLTGTWTTTYISAVPEPRTYLCLLLGLTLFSLILRKR